MMYAAHQIEGTWVGLVRERGRIEMASAADAGLDDANLDGRRVSAEIFMPRRGAVAPKGMKARGGLSKESPQGRVSAERPGTQVSAEGPEPIRPPDSEADPNSDPDRDSEPDPDHDPGPEHQPDSEPDPDALYELGERCAETYMQADALQYEAMVLLAEYDAREGWRGTGFGGTAEWLAWRVGIMLATAKDRLRVALALPNLPLTSQAMARGELSYSKARGMARWARPEGEAELLEFAQATSAARFERECRALKLLDRHSELSAAQIRHRNRRFSVFVDEDGSYVVTGRLDPEVGALLMRAIEAASDALFRDEAAKDSSERTQPEHRRADAVGLLAERALAAGFSGDGRISGTRAERYQVVLHVDEETLRADGEPDRCELEDGTRLSAETARRLACDAAIVRIGHGKDGRILSVGRKTRRVPVHIRRALEARDKGCRFPACGLRFTDAHHVEHWADGGETDFRKLILLCDKHHTAVHEGQVRVCLNHEGEAVFFTPNGDVLRGSPPVRATAQAGNGVADTGNRAANTGNRVANSRNGATQAGHDAHAILPRHRRPLDEPAREILHDPARQTLPWHKKGADRYSDAELPLEILNRAREAL